MAEKKVTPSEELRRARAETLRWGRELERRREADRIAEEMKALAPTWSAHHLKR